MNNFSNLNLKEIFDYISDIQSGKMKYRVYDLNILEDNSMLMDYTINISDSGISHDIQNSPRFKTKQDAEEFVIWKIKSNPGRYANEYIFRTLKGILKDNNEIKEILENTIKNEENYIKREILSKERDIECFNKKLEALNNERNNLLNK